MTKALRRIVAVIFGRRVQDPQLSALKAERARPRRERRRLDQIDADMRRIVHTRLKLAVRK